MENNLDLIKQWAAMKLRALLWRVQADVPPPKPARWQETKPAVRRPKER
jgi:hypothetical protein